jgi:hypothetical protein
MFYGQVGFLNLYAETIHSHPVDIRKATMISAISGRMSIQSRDVELLEGMRE